jgi:spermidine dehydrogenase
LPLAEQAATSRMQLFGMSFRQIEMAIREQLTKMFSAYGFDAKRDIAGIVANRQGHAYVVTPPGFYYGKDGQSAPSDVIRMRHGRIAFGHSELQGAQLWMGAVEEGERAVQQILEVG